MKIVAVDILYFLPIDREKLNKLGELVIYDTNPKDQNEAASRIRDADIVINSWYPLPKEIIKQTQNLKFICAASVGFDKIDIETAKEKNIVVSNCPGNNAEAVAEYTIALLLNAARYVEQAQKDLRNGMWHSEKYKGKELKGKTLGVIGYGTIGKRVAEIAEKGFGMKILFVNSQSAREDLEKLLKESDFISINAPRNKQTEGMIGTKEFDVMKQGVVLVNTGRGALIDEEALIKNVQSGKIAAAGLDVMQKEPMDTTSPLFSFENVSITPHAAWNTTETEERLSQQVVENIEAFIKNTPQNVVSK